MAISHLSATGSDLLHRAFALAFGLVAFTVMIVFLAAVGCRALSVRMSAGRAVEPATVR